MLVCTRLQAQGALAHNLHCMEQLALKLHSGKHLLKLVLPPAWHVRDRPEARGREGADNSPGYAVEKGTLAQITLPTCSVWHDFHVRKVA